MKHYLVFIIFALYGTIGTVPEVPNPNAVPVHPGYRLSSYPFISGDTFRNFCQHVFDETLVVFNPFLVDHGDTVFVRNDVLDIYFEKYHNKIRNKYILITHNGDDSVPGPFASFLDDPKIIAWFADNVACKHPKLYPIPIGLANRHWPHGNIEVLKKTLDSFVCVDQKMNSIYCNFHVHTNQKSREPIWEYFKKKPFCFVRENQAYRDYLEDMKRCRFVISPPGNALDCHRTWEALYVKSIPILEHSSLDELFEDLPVIFIDAWQEVDEVFLEKKYQEITKRSYNEHKLYAQYWFDRINAMQQRARN